jgi:hypothetical protein
VGRDKSVLGQSVAGLGEDSLGQFHCQDPPRTQISIHEFKRINKTKNFNMKSNKKKS